MFSGLAGNGTDKQSIANGRFPELSQQVSVALCNFQLYSKNPTFVSFVDTSRVGKKWVLNHTDVGGCVAKSGEFVETRLDPEADREVIDLEGRTV